MMAIVVSTCLTENIEVAYQEDKFEYEYVRFPKLNYSDTIAHINSKGLLIIPMMESYKKIQEEHFNDLLHLCEKEKLNQIQLSASQHAEVKKILLTLVNCIFNIIYLKFQLFCFQKTTLSCFFKYSDFRPHESKKSQIAIFV